jgi:hypothetical protein
MLKTNVVTSTALPWLKVHLKPINLKQIKLINNKHFLSNGVCDENNPFGDGYFTAGYHDSAG